MTLFRKLSAATGWLLAGLIATPAAGQRGGDLCSPATITHALAGAFASEYILPQPAARGAAELRRLVRENRLVSEEGSQRELADQLTRTLRTSTGDGHVSVEWIDPAGPPVEEANWIAQWKAGAPRANYGISRVEVLPGNVGYIALRSFHTYADAAPTLRAAMNLVQHTEGLILDLQGNGGGDDETARAIAQTFLEPATGWPLRTETRRGTDPASPPTPLQWEPYGTRRPLAVLLDGRSFSAPEAVAFVLAGSGRAVVIGSRSAGGAHMIERASPLPCGFQAWIPTRRPFDARTGANWEGTGVAPEIEAEGGAAVSVAHLQLLRLLRERSTNLEAREELARLIAEVEGERRPLPENEHPR